MSEGDFNTNPVLERVFIEDVLLKGKTKEVSMLFMFRLNEIKAMASLATLTRETLVILLMLTENEIERKNKGVSNGNV